MLCQFSFKNFKSYQKTAVLDMQAANIEEFSDSLIPAPGENFTELLPVSVIYGPNGGGKSNIIHAFAYFIGRIMRPIRNSTGISTHFTSFLTEYRPFLFDNHSKTEPTEFEVFFRTEGRQYQYQLSILGDTVTSESLYYIRTPCMRKRPTRLFERTNNTIITGTALNKANSQKINDNIPYISFLAINYSFPEIQDAVDWFNSCCVINYSLAGMDQRISSFLNDPTIKPLVLTFLKNMDIPISNYDIIEEELESQEKKTRIVTNHNVNGNSYTLDLKDESQGSIKILSAIPAVIMSLISGSPLIVDELDAKLHPQLVKYLISLYTLPENNPKHAQLIFNCHDTNILKNYILRRDEIWFAARNSEGASELWSLYDMCDEKGDRIKNTAAYDKQYLAGRYGADPFLNEIVDWGEIHG